jgi:hypothetical protein
MIVEISKEKYTEFQSEEDQVGQEKELSTFSIKLTKYPTEADINSLGYHEGKKLEDIENPTTR